MKAAFRDEGHDIIDFGIGNPDMDTPGHIVNKLVETVQKPRTHRYSASAGIPGLRRAQTGYYQRRFGVTLDPDTQVVATPGWRMGFAVGNPRLIEALKRIKSYLDYGAFTPVQVAAAAALNGPQDCIAEIRAVYQTRRDVLVEAMGRAGWAIPAPPATMFAWAPVPEPFRALGSMEFAKILLREADVAISPGVGFGEYGEGYVRLGLVENEQRIRQAARNVRRLMDRADEIVGKYTQLNADTAD